MMEQTYSFCIAEHFITIRSLSPAVNIKEITPSLEPFACENAGEELLFALTVEDVLEVDESVFREIGDFDTGNGHIKVDKNDESGEYKFLIRDIRERPVALMVATGDFVDCRCRLLCDTRDLQRFAINNALMLAYAFAGAKHHTLLIHASCVKQGEYAYAFIAKSGTGKSTQVSNWLKYLPDTELLNDDNPIVRVKDDGVFIYGSPWSGKTPCYRNIKAKLGALTRIVRDKKNWVEHTSAVKALASVLPSCSSMTWDKVIYNDVIDTVTDIISTVGIYSLHCLPDRESAEVCHREIACV